MKIKFLFLLFIIINNAFAYVATRTEYNQNLKWDDSSQSLDIYVDPTPIGMNTSSLSEEEIEDIVNETISTWNQYSPYTLDHTFTDNLPPLATSRSIRFSNDTSYFGSGVLAVTSISHSAATGKIYSADILINDSITNPNTFTDDESVSGGYYAYLGDVLSHEVGHLMGLGHSEVFGSTMVFSVFKDQHSIHSDDISGLDYLYEHLNDGGNISGTIITGNGVAVFGAQVQAISYKTGKVVAGVLTETNGAFSINELPKDDSYLIYVLPPRGVDNLPAFYQSIQTRYCSGNSFVPSFFTRCGAASNGKPQAIELSETESSVDVGSITIKCDEGLDPNYLFSKGQNSTLTIQKVTQFNKEKALGSTHIGYFSNTDIANELNADGDKLEIDLREFTVPEDTLYNLNIKLITKEIGSAFGLYANIYDYNNNLIQSADISYGSLFERETDLEFNLSLSLDESENVFTIKVFPRSISSTELNEIFANHTTMSNKNSTYLVLTSIKSYQNGIYKTYGLKNSYPYEDNYYCTEGEATVTARPNVVSGTSLGESTSEDEATEQPNAMSCGTLDVDSGSGPGGGAMSFGLGLVLIFLMRFTGRKTNDFFV